MKEKQKASTLPYWVILILGLIFFSGGCAASKRTKPCKQCPQYTQFVVPVCDTFIVYIPHYNHNMRCYPARKIRCITYDTLYIENL
jgi:hypothetical protein